MRPLFCLMMLDRLLRVFLFLFDSGVCVGFFIFIRVPFMFVICPSSFPSPSQHRVLLPFNYRAHISSNITGNSFLPRSAFGLSFR